MLTLVDPREPLPRRGFLTIGALGTSALGMGALGLGGLGLSGRAVGAETSGRELLPSHLTGKSVIFLFQQGGPSQFETFDPKPDAPDGVRTVTDTIETSLPGVFFGGSLPQLAQRADRLTVVRSFQTNNAGHNIQPIVSEETQQANLGSYYSHVAGAVRSDSGMPTHAVLFPQAVDSKVTRGSARGDISATGKLAQSSAPFIPGAGGQLQKDMQLNLARDRFEDRQYLLAALDELGHAVEGNSQGQQTVTLRRQAEQLLLGDRVAAAFDLSREDRETIARYDTSRYARNDGWSKVNRGRRGYYTGHAKSLGKLLLLARRLCEAGCGYVTIHADYEGVWDMHADSNNLNMVDGMEAVGRTFDHAVSAFIDDVEARGLSRDIQLVCCGEMGRTPKINARGGRDHWGRLAPLMIYGGGTRGGQVIGQSTRDGGEPATEPYQSRHLVSTVLHSVFDVTQLRLLPHFNTVSRLAEVDTIPIWG